MANILGFFNGYICRGGKLRDESLYVDLDTGFIVDAPFRPIRVKYDLRGLILAPAFLELQTNGCAGVHFTHYADPELYTQNLGKVSKHLRTTGVGSFWATIPTVSSDVFQNILPLLKPRTFDGGAELLGAHCEGPFLNPLKKGAHDASLMQVPDRVMVEEIYGEDNLRSSIKMVTLAPEVSAGTDLIKYLRTEYQIVSSLGHSAADFDTGARALKCGARSLTHVFNAMEPLAHRHPGLAGLMAMPKSSDSQPPYFSIIADGIHVHPAVVAMAYRSNPERCILITDSLEMAGLPDGLYPGHAQIPHPQRKVGNKVTIEGSDTLIGSCIGLDECVRNLVKYSGCNLAQAVRCVTENVANMMGVKDRGVIETGRRADFVCLDSDGHVQQVLFKGRMVS